MKVDVDAIGDPRAGTEVFAQEGDGVEVEVEGELAG